MSELKYLLRRKNLRYQRTELLVREVIKDVVEDSLLVCVRSQIAGKSTKVICMRISTS